MNLAHLLNNADPTQPKGISVTVPSSGAPDQQTVAAPDVDQVPRQSVFDQPSPHNNSPATVPRLHIASDALTLERVTGHLQEISARNGDSSEAVDVVVAVPAISWASQAGPEISRMMTTTAQMSLSIMQRRITNRRIRWWLCVDLETASETILTAVRVAGVSALRQMDPVPGVVGTLVLMGDPEASADALQRFVTDAQWAGSCLIDLTGDLNADGRITANVVAVSPRNSEHSAEDQPTRRQDDLENSRGEIGRAHV